MRRFSSGLAEPSTVPLVQSLAGDAAAAFPPIAAELHQTTGIFPPVAGFQRRADTRSCLARASGELMAS